MFFHFTIYDTKHNPPNNFTYIIKNSVFLLFGISKCKLKCVSWIWKFGYFALEKFWKYFKRSLYESCFKLNGLKSSVAHARESVLFL